MKDFELLCSAYFRDFESYRIHIGLLSWRTLALAISLAFFVLGSVHFFRTNSAFLLLPSEIVLLTVWTTIDKYKNARILTRLNSCWESNFQKVSEARKEWLKRSINAPPSDYCKIANEISNAYKLRKEHKVSFSSSFSDILLFVFDPSSKARILSLIIFLFSLVSLLTLRSYEEGNIPVEIFFSENFPQYIYFLLFLAFILWFTFISLRLVTEFISSFMLGVLDALRTGNTFSSRSFNQLILALIEHHNIAKINDKNSELSKKRFAASNLRSRNRRP